MYVETEIFVVGNQIITEELILMMGRHVVLREALEWLCEEPRTWQQLIDHNRWWANWVATECSSLPDEVRDFLFTQIDWVGNNL